VKRYKIDDVLRQVASNVRLGREQRGWTQPELATRARISRGSVAHLEAGRGGRLGTIIRVANAFGYLPAALLLPPVWSPAQRKEG
jgi:transcriptional regulator with XRE-family HTH domain